ncbi:MAG: hypothetical protein U1E31_01050 [Rickettsiales bacterium]
MRKSLTISDKHNFLDRKKSKLNFNVTNNFNLEKITKIFLPIVKILNNKFNQEIIQLKYPAQEKAFNRLLDLFFLKFIRNAIDIKQNKTQEEKKFLNIFTKKITIFQNKIALLIEKVYGFQNSDLKKDKILKIFPKQEKKFLNEIKQIQEEDYNYTSAKDIINLMFKLDNNFLLNKIIPKITEHDKEDINIKLRSIKNFISILLGFTILLKGENKETYLFYLSHIKKDQEDNDQEDNESFSLIELDTEKKYSTQIKKYIIAIESIFFLNEKNLSYKLIDNIFSDVKNYIKNLIKFYHEW